MNCLHAFNAALDTILSIKAKQQTISSTATRMPNLIPKTINNNFLSLVFHIFYYNFINLIT